MRDTWTLESLARYMAVDRMDTADQQLIDGTIDELHDQATLIQREIFEARMIRCLECDDLYTAHHQIMRDVDMLMPQSSVPY